MQIVTGLAHSDVLAGSAALCRAANHEWVEGRNDACHHWCNRQRIRNCPKRFGLHYPVCFLEHADRFDVCGTRMGLADWACTLRRRSAFRAPDPDAAGRAGDGSLISAWRGLNM